MILDTDINEHGHIVCKVFCITCKCEVWARLTETPKMRILICPNCDEEMAEETQ